MRSPEPGRVTPAYRAGFHHGWIIVIASGVLLWITNGMALSGLTVFDEELLALLAEDRGAEGLRGALKFRDTITLFGSGLLAPFAGTLADRFGVRPLMIAGLLCLTAAHWLYAGVASLGGIYGIHVLIAMSLASAGLVVNVMIVSRWFVHRRGTAIGIALAGTSLGNAAFPQINVWLIAEFGWRDAFAWIALIPLLMVPVVLLVMREPPAAGGSGTLVKGTGPGEGLTFREALGSANFWILALVAMCTFYAILAMATHLFLHMRGQGFDPATAGRGVGLMFLLGLAGKIISGMLTEWLPRRTVFLGALGIMAAGALLLVNTGQVAFWPALVLVGLGWGGLYTLLQLLAADAFGLRDLGKILGTITVLDTFGGGMGPFLTGLMYDRFGSYDVAFMVIAGLVGTAFLIATRFHLPARRVTAS